MLTVTYGQLRDQTFGRAMGKMANCSQYKSQQLAINIARINMKIMDEAKLADEQYQKLVRQYCKKDEKGEIVPHEGRPGSFTIPEENVKEWTSKVDELNAITFEIDRPRINVSDVHVPAQLSPMELGALECLLNFDEPTPLKAVPKAE